MRLLFVVDYIYLLFLCTLWQLCPWGNIVVGSQDILKNTEMKLNVIFPANRVVTFVSVDEINAVR